MVDAQTDLRCHNIPPPARVNNVQDVQINVHGQEAEVHDGKGEQAGPFSPRVD